jgi:tryptophan halogenase
MKQVKSILVVGGGTAGLIAAIVLKKKLNVDIDIVRSKNIGVIGVGEGSTEHWKEFMDYAGINHYDLLKECDATYKIGIMFENWSKESYLHSVASPYNTSSGQYRYVYGKLISENLKPLTSKTFWKNEIDRGYVNRPEAFAANQFHFNTHKLNEFLIKHAEQLGIRVIDDDIDEVFLNNDGSIKSIKGLNEYFYDFYIDSTGFRRVLMNKLGGRWKSFSKYLKMNSAVTFQTPDEDNYNFWTLARAMDHGWLFRIPVWGRYGNGYIYDKNFADEETIKKEISDYFGYNIEIKKTFEFDPGMLDEVWIKNCCAIGLSGSFVEPLEASSIGTSIQQAFLLMHKIGHYDQTTIDSYNKSFSDIMSNVLDFVFLHYNTKKNNTEFWKHISTVEAPDSLKNNLKIWKHRLPIREDFSSLSDYILFKEDNFIMVMEGLELFDRNSIRHEYQSLHPAIRANADSVVDNQNRLEDISITIPHKNMIKLIRENF